MDLVVAARKIFRFAVTESTNSVALTLGEKGEPPGTLIVAGSQTGGRGRLKRSWLSLPGMGLYFSILLRPRLPSEDLPKITLAAGLAVCKVIETEYRLAPLIKWPNDLLLGGRKFGGILTETGGLQNLSAGGPPLVVVGVGVNLFTPEGGFPAPLEERATSLELHTSREIDPDALLQKCGIAIEEVVARLEMGDFPAILEEWRERDAIGDNVLTWVTPQGREVTGVSLGPDADGVLRIRDRAGVVYTVLSGDVNLVGKKF